MEEGNPVRFLISLSHTDSTFRPAIFLFSLNFSARKNLAVKIAGFPNTKRCVHHFFKKKKMKFAWFSFDVWETERQRVCQMWFSAPVKNEREKEDRFLKIHPTLCFQTTPEKYLLFFSKTSISLFRKVPLGGLYSFLDLFQ